MRTHVHISNDSVFYEIPRLVLMERSGDPKYFPKIEHLYEVLREYGIQKVTLTVTLDHSLFVDSRNYICEL